MGFTSRVGGGEGLRAGSGGHLGTIEATILNAIRRRFAGREAAVERAFGASAPFRDLCRDYLACVAALERWQGSKSREALLRTAEYSDLKDELTREIEVRLGAHER